MVNTAEGRVGPSRRHRRRITTAGGDTLSVTELVVRYVLLLMVVAITVGPFVWEFLTSIKGHADDLYAQPPKWLPKHANFHNYVRVSHIIPVLRFVLNSVIVAAANVAVNVLGASLAGYALARLKFRGRRVALGVFLAALLIPAEAAIISMLQMINDIHLSNTLVAVVLPQSIAALNVLLMMNAFSAIPREIDEAAVIDGANVWKRFRTIGIPAVKGTMAVVGLLSFMGGWDDFLWPLLVLTDTNKYTLTVGLNYLQSTFNDDPRVVAAGTMIAVAPLIALFLVLQKQFFKGVGEGGIKG